MTRLGEGGAWVARALAVLCAAAGSLWQLSLVARLWWGMARYPWDIEWLESSALYQAYRVMHHLPTYGPMRDGYLPHNHPPLYPAALGVLGWGVGLDYPMARTFSFACFLGAAALVVRAMVRRLEGRIEGLGARAPRRGRRGERRPADRGDLHLRPRGRGGPLPLPCSWPRWSTARPA